MSADRLQRLIDTPANEPLADDLVAWMREALEAAVLDQVPVAEALAIQGSSGVSDAPAQVRRTLRDRALLMVGRSLEPDGTPYRQAAAVFDAWHDGRPVPPEAQATLQYAARLAGIPANFRNIYAIFRECAETPISNHRCSEREAG